MKLFIIFALSAFPFLANAQKKDKLYIGLQVEPELTFYKSGYNPNTYPPNYSKSSFNIGFNLYGQYQITDNLFATLGLGFISRKLNTTVYLDKSRLPAPYTDSTGPAIFPNRVSYRILQIPISFGYYFLKTKKIYCFAGLAFVPNFLLNTKYGDGIPYPAFRKNYWQGFSLNPNVGLDYNLSPKIKLTGAIAFSLINTVRKEEYEYREPELKHRYLQLGLGVKLKLQ